MTTGWEKPIARKCPFCVTDYMLGVRDSTGGRMAIVVHVWGDYGRTAENVLESVQIFHWGGSLRIDASAVPRRNLQTVSE